MCDRLLTRSQTTDLLHAHGYTRHRVRILLDTGVIPAHPHGMHSRRLWLKSRVKSWLDTQLAAAHPSPVVVPGEECSRPPGVHTPRS